MEVDLSIPEGAPPEIVNGLLALQQELEEGDITAKGYRKHRDILLAQWTAQNYEVVSIKPTSSIRSNRRQSSIASMQDIETRTLTHVPDSPDIMYLQSLPALQAPVLPRGIPETARSDPLNRSVRLTKFDNLPSILRHRAKTNSEIVAFTLLGEKGKESQNITWGRLASRSERVAQELRERSGLFRGDRVVLLYFESEPFEFIIALLGCFLAGLVAVPFQPEYLTALPKILFSTQCHLVLTSELTFKRVKTHNTFQQLSNINWWKTTDWDKMKKAELPALQVPDLAYIDYGISPVGEFRGVVMSHRTILHQMSCLTAIYQSRDAHEGRNSKVTTDKLICSLDIRRSTGLIFGILHTIYAGNSAFFIPKRVMVVPGLYAHIVSKYRMTVLLSDSSSLKEVCYNYQKVPDATRSFKKHTKVDLGSVRSVLVNSREVDIEFLIALADRWLSPLGNKRGRDIVSPMLTLTEHGGMVIAMRDWITTEGRHGPSDLRTIYLDRGELKRNRVEFATTSNNTEALGVGPFGNPLADATVAVVDPETKILCPEGEAGELWIDSPSISGGFWGLADDTDTTFHAHCYDRDGKLEMDFLRTGILGFVSDGEVYMLGLLEDRLMQIKVPQLRDPEDEEELEPIPEPTYYYSSHLAYTIATSVPKVKECCLFQVPLAGKLVSYVIVETPLAKPVMFAGGTKETERDMMLDEMALQVISVLRAVHDFTVYCVLVTAPDVTPRIKRSGEPEIAKMMARKYVKDGYLQSFHVKFNTDQVLTDLPRGQDPNGGIWSSAISYIRSESSGNNQDLQYSGVDMRNNVLDDRTSQPMDSFGSIMDIFQWRVKMQPEELAYLSVQARVESNRETTWAKMDQQVAAVYYYLKEHLLAQPGQAAMLMYTHGEQFVVAVLACMFLGLTVVPINTINTERVEEDLPALLKIQRQHKAHYLLGNHETYAIMESKPVTHFLRNNRGAALHKLHNTAKVKVRAGISCKTLKTPEVCTSRDFAALVWLTFTPDHDFIASQMSHASILGMCKIQKETCQMSSTKPIIGCVRSVLGLGFLYTCCLGIYVGSSTILVSPVDYANNPSTYFLTSSRYKVNDGYATIQMLEHACRTIKPKGYSLSELQNLLVTCDSRADTEIVNKMRKVFMATGLETIAVNMSYGCIGNPVVTTRSYMQLESIDLWLDPAALRQGYVSIVNKWNCPNALHIQDSGMVTVNTQIAIVNPETRKLCRTGEFGEIWVLSDGNQTKFHLSSDEVNNDVMRGVIDGGDSEVEYMRTGDFGFLHSVTKGSDGELQVLFVLGPIAQTIEVNGLQHFIGDVEQTIEQAHAQILRAVLFTIGSRMTVLCVETGVVKERLPALCTVVVNRVLEEHEFVADIVVFVAKSGVPLSRLGEKQRKRLITSYVRGKLPILAQFGIRAQT